MSEEFHYNDCGIAGGMPHPASAHKKECTCLEDEYRTWDDCSEHGQSWTDNKFNFNSARQLNPNNMVGLKLDLALNYIDSIKLYLNLDDDIVSRRDMILKELDLLGRILCS